MKDTNTELFRLVLPYDYEMILNDYLEENGLNVVVDPIHCEALTEILKNVMFNTKNDNGDDLLDEVLNKFQNIPRVQSVILAQLFWSWAGMRTASEVWEEINDYIDFKLFCGGPDTTYEDFNEHKVNLGELAENWRDFNEWVVNTDPDKDDFIAIFRNCNPEKEPTFVKVKPSYPSVPSMEVMTNGGEA